MKSIKYIFILALSFQAYAGDLIFKNGFENSVLIAGNVTGLNSTGLLIELQVEGAAVEQISIDEDGAFIFSTELIIGDSWIVNIFFLPSSPNQQSCAIINNNGTAAIGSGNDVLIECNDTPWEWDVMNWDEGGWQ